MRIIESVSKVNPFTNSTNTSYYDVFLDDESKVSRSNYTVKDYYRFEKGVEGRIEYMTADEYFDRCNKYSGDNYRLTGQRSLDKVLQYAKDMSKGDKFPLPYINQSKNNFGQEGRHRMLAASKVYGSQTKSLY